MSSHLSSRVGPHYRLRPRSSSQNCPVSVHQGAWSEDSSTIRSVHHQFVHGGNDRLILRVRLPVHRRRHVRTDNLSSGVLLRASVMRAASRDTPRACRPEYLFPYSVFYSLRPQHTAFTPVLHNNNSRLCMSLRAKQR